MSKRKLTPEQKAILVERLKKAREAKKKISPSIVRPFEKQLLTTVELPEFIKPECKHFWQPFHFNETNMYVSLICAHCEKTKQIKI